MFNFLNSIQPGLAQYFSPSMNQVSSTLEQFFPSKNNNMRMDASNGAPKLPVAHASAPSQPQEPVQQPQTLLPGEHEWVAMQRQQGSHLSEPELHALYHKGTSAPGGHLYQPPTTPAPTVPPGTDLAMQVIQSEMPKGSRVEEYYPAFQDPGFMAKIQAADKIKPGLANLLLLQAFHESTLGRGGNAIFGAKPGGEAANFTSPSAAVDYQLGPSMLGGGGNPKNMDLVHDQSPLTADRVRQLYSSYDPQGAYLPMLLQELRGGGHQ
jgi:hypothetical protein